MRRHLPLVVARNLATAQLEKARLASSFFLGVRPDTVTCRKGCTHCCHYPLAISLWEGLELYEALRDADAWNSTLRQDLEKHSSRVFGLSPEVWLLAEIPCPLLADGACTAYAHRPFRCRVTVSQNDPEFCRPVHFQNGTFVDSRLEMAEFHALENRLSKQSREHVRGMEQTVPLSTAVLIGHQVAEGLITLEGVPLALAKLLSAPQPV